MMDRTQKLVDGVGPPAGNYGVEAGDSWRDQQKGNMPGRSVSGNHSRNRPQNVRFKRSLPKGASPSRSVGAVQNGTACSASSYADITYHNTLYERFPLPKLVFGFQISEQGKVSNCRLGVVADEELKCSTEMFCYPFSNVRQERFSSLYRKQCAATL